MDIYQEVADALNVSRATAKSLCCYLFYSRIKEIDDANSLEELRDAIIKCIRKSR